jgi:hypothetical protein
MGGLNEENARAPALLTQALLFLPLVVACFSLYVILCHRLARPRPRANFFDDASQPNSWVIGLGWNVLGFVCWVSYPFARLEIFDQGLRIAPNGIVARPLVPRWELFWIDLAEVQDGHFILTIAVKCGAGKLRVLPRTIGDKKAIFQAISKASYEFQLALG